MKNIYRTKKEITYCCNYHVVWCTKYKRKVLSDKIHDRLYELINDICSEQSIDLFQILIDHDHVYLSLSIDPQIGPHKVIKKIKAVTSHVLRAEFDELRSKIPTLWTNSYFISTEDQVPVSDIKKYLECQKTTWRK